MLAVNEPCNSTRWSASTLALLVTTAKGLKLIEIDRPVISIGREMGNTLRIPHPEEGFSSAAAPG